MRLVDLLAVDVPCVGLRAASSAHNLNCSISRSCNCHDSMVAESFFQFLERNRIGRQICVARLQARLGICNEIAMFYAP